MIIPIDENYRIISDKYCWIIQSKRFRYGEEHWESRLYYPSLVDSVEGLTRLKIRLSDANNVIDAIDDVQRIVKEITIALSRTLVPKI